MPTKRRAPVKKTAALPVTPPKEKEVKDETQNPQFITEVVEEVPPPPELPVNEGVDVPADALETIKEKATEIEEVVEEIQEEKKEAESQESFAEEKSAKDEEPDGETVPVESAVPVAEVIPPEQKRANDKETLEELFTKESPASVFPDITEHKSTSPAPVFLWAIIIIAVALLTGGTLLVVVSGLPKLPTMFTKPTPTPTPAPTPTPTPAAAARGDIKIQILNGGGTPGSASKAKAFLEKKGYTIAETGNTDKYTYTKTEILVKSGKEAYLEFLKADLKEDYTVGTASATLPADVSFDARVIVGKE